MSWFSAIHTSTLRSAEQTRIGIVWSYDGTARIGTPPRLYGQIALQPVLRRTSDPLEMARTLALAHVAFADATTAAWNTKYVDDFWRPVTAVREAAPAAAPPARATATGPRRRLELDPARFTRQQSDRPELHAAVPRLPLGPCGARWRHVAYS